MTRPPPSDSRSKIATETRFLSSSSDSRNSSSSSSFVESEPLSKWPTRPGSHVCYVEWLGGGFGGAPDPEKGRRWGWREGVEEEKMEEEESEARRRQWGRSPINIFVRVSSRSAPAFPPSRSGVEGGGRRVAEIWVHPRYPLLNETQLRRSKSCAEGRSSGVDELEIWFKNPDEFDEPEPRARSKSSSSSPRIESGKKKMKDEEEFKCGALCLYLPRFGGGSGKVKTVRERKAI
ncbi:hypothetical protein LINPERHAP2_LOCUS23361 [Linum perenne]